MVKLRELQFDLLAEFSLFKPLSWHFVKATSVHSALFSDCLSFRIFMPGVRVARGEASSHVAWFTDACL